MIFGITGNANSTFVSLLLKSNDHQNQASYRMAHVVSWCHEHNVDFWSCSSCWSVDIQLSHFQVGDRVVIQDCPKKHHGKEGIVLKILKMEKSKSSSIMTTTRLFGIYTTTVHPQHLEGVTTTYAVHRMNVHGGGTVKELHSDSDTLISLEWVDAASPVIDLDEGTLRAICPTCRAVEPLHKAYDDDDDDDSIDSHHNNNNTSVPFVWKPLPTVVFWNAITSFVMSVGISGEILPPTWFPSSLLRKFRKMNCKTRMEPSRLT